MYLLLRALLTFTVLLALSPLLKAQGIDDTQAPPLTHAHCLAELDSMIALAENETRHNLSAVNEAGSLAAMIDFRAIDTALAELEARCPTLPQLAHNRGVLAAKAERWSDAVAHLERSLASDPRAAETHRLLQGILEHQASQAYARALDVPVDIPLPPMPWQDSTRLNADAAALLRAQRDPDATAIQTHESDVEYELFSWWHAREAGEDTRAFHVDGYPEQAIRRSRQLHAGTRWQDLKRHVSLTARDAVAVLTDARQRQTLILLRRVGTRWKIYQESRL